MAKLREHAPSAHSGPSELAGLIKRCAANEPPHYGVKIDARDSLDTALLEILREIDETMLPRRVTIQCGPSGPVTLLLSNRRLLAVDTQNDTHISTARSPKEAAQGFASILRTVLDQADSIVFETPKHVSSQDFADLSVSASLLGQALGVHDFETSLEGTQMSLPATITACALASVDATQGLTFSNATGAQEDIDQLKSFWGHYMGAQTRPRQNTRLQTAAQTCCVVPTDATRGVAVVAKGKDTWHLALVPRDRFQALADCAI